MVSIAAMLLSSELHETRYIEFDTPAAGASLPTLGSPAAVQEYTSGDQIQDAYICSGTVVVISSGNLIGIAKNDEIAGTTDALYIIGADRIYVPLHASATVTKGAPVYVVEATGLFTHDSGVGDFIVGKFLGSAAETPVGLPTAAGNWAEIIFSQANA